MRDPAQTAPPPPNPLADMLLTVVAPSFILEYLSKPERLGPVWALVLSSLIPLGYGLWCLWQKRGWNVFSTLGLIAIIVTGSLGLLNLTAIWFAVKEASFAVFLGLAFPFSYYWGKPLVSELLLNPQIIRVKTLHQAISSTGQEKALQRLLERASWWLAATMLLSAAGNALLVWYYLKDTAPGSEAYTAAIGRQNWVGFIVIGVPLTAAMLLLILRLLRQLQKLTGLPAEALLVSSSTVSKTIRREEP